MKSSKETQSPILSWEWLVQFRRTIHLFPEPSFEEFVTAEMIKKALIEEAGIRETDIRCNLGKDDNTGTGIIVDIMGEGSDIIVLKDPKIRLINPTKPDIQIISRKILSNIIETVKAKTKYNQWKNSDSVIKWFSDLPDKNRLKFISFDVVSMY